MGFFGSLIGGFLQTLGDVVSTISPTIGDAIWNAGIDIEFGRIESTYSSSKATASETIDFQAECNKACEDARKKTRKAIEEVIAQAKSSVKSFERKVKKIGAEGLDFSLPDDYFDSMEDAYLNYIQHEVSVDSKNFTKILEIKDDKKRKSECKKYIDTVVHEAKKRAINHLNNKRFDALDSLSREMKIYLDEKESIMKERKRQLEDLDSNREDEAFVNQIYKDHIVDITYLSCIKSECV